MRGATRLLAACGLIAILVAVVESGSGVAKVAASARGPAMMAGRLGSSPFAASNRTPLGTPFHSNTLAGWLTSQTGSVTLSTSFHVAKLNCATDNGFAPAAFVFTASSNDAAGVLDQCVGGVHYITPDVRIDGVDNDFT